MELFCTKAWLRNMDEKYGLSIGDTLEVKNGNPDDPLVECQIAGLFEVIADDNDEQATMARPSTFYDYEEYIFVDMDTMSAISAPYTASEGNGITSVDCNDYRGKHGTDHPDPFHVYPKPQTGNRDPAGSRD